MNSPIKIDVGGNRYALVDQADAEVVKKYRWSAYKEHDGKIRAHTNIMVNGKRRRINLASLITGRRPSEVVMFRNNNPLDCCRSNLLVVDRKTHVLKFAAPNGRKRKDKASAYTGVQRIKGKGGVPHWTAFIRPHGRMIYLGRYRSEEDAARAYDIAAMQHYGERAMLNFPDRVGEVPPLRSSQRVSYREIHCARCGRPCRVTNPRQKNCRRKECLRPFSDLLDAWNVLV